MITSILKTAAAVLLAHPPLSPFAEQFIPRSARRFFFDADVLLQYQAQKQLDHFSASELHALQFCKLKKILMHAAMSVPYWKDCFDAIGFDPRRMRDISEIQAVPMTSRTLMKCGPIERFLSSAVDPRRKIAMATSGSTGEPLAFFQDAQEIPRRSSVGFLASCYNNFAQRTPILVIGFGDHRSLRRLGKNIVGADLESEQFRNGEFYPLLERYRPRVIYGTTSYLLRLAHYWKQDRVATPLCGVLYTGERMDEEMQQELRRVFQCPLGGYYATKECAAIAVTCLYGRYHNIPSLHYVEIVDEIGRPCPEGESGRVVVTYFENMVLPFIRYQTGDEGCIEKEPCRCGRKSKVLRIFGREPWYVEIGGVPVNVRFLEFIMMRYSRSIQKFQIVQIAPDALRIRYVGYVDQSLNEERLASAIRDALHAHIGIGRGVTIFFARVSDILPNHRGKTPLFVGLKSAPHVSGSHKG